MGELAVFLSNPAFNKIKWYWLWLVIITHLWQHRISSL